MRKFLEKYPLFLLLLPAFVVIHLEKELHDLIQYKFVYDRIIILFIAPFIILGIWYLFFRTIAIASLITISSLLPFYYTGDLKSWLSVKFPHSFSRCITTNAGKSNRNNGYFSRNFLICGIIQKN